MERQALLWMWHIVWIEQGQMAEASCCLQDLYSWPLPLTWWTAAGFWEGA